MAWQRRWNERISSLRDELRRLIPLKGLDEIPVVTNGSVERLSEWTATPPVDIYENDREIVLIADVPGGTREGTTVAWDNERRLTLTVTSGDVEARRGHERLWYRAFELPAYADGSRASSVLRDGVLTVKVPKRALKPKLIPVKAA